MALPHHFRLLDLVKDQSIKKALQTALSDDGKLSYEEVQTIIYSACDGAGFSQQEINDLGMILQHSRSIDGRTKQLIKSFQNNPRHFLKFRGFSSGHLQMIMSDLAAAEILSQHCANLLVMSQLPRDKVDKLLRDTFSIGIRDAEKVRMIQSKFLSFRPRMEKTKFIYKGDQRKEPGFMSESAWVVHAEPFNIYVGSPYFNDAPNYRAALLIHEYIHHVNDRSGHPGGDKVFFGRGSIGLSFAEAVKNPWCYQYFAMWSQQL